jgi:hypothetical protein
MCPANQIDIVLFQEVGDDISSKDETYSSLILCPSCHPLFWVCPQKIAE